MNLVKNMDFQNNEYSKYTNEQSLKAWLIGRLGVCIDERARLEYECELREILNEQEAA
jgi:hypothetical protein